MNKPVLYTEINGPQRRVVSDLVGEFVDEIGSMCGRCIDIGSGPGDVLADLILPKFNNEATVVCSDISEKMLKFGREKYADNERMSFVQLDIESLNLPQHLIGQFDHATSFYCIHWCRNMRQVFANIFNLLRPGGTALVAFIAQSDFFDAYEVLAWMPRYQPWMTNVDRYIPAFQYDDRPRETLKELLGDVGFETYHSSNREKYFIFHTPDALGKFSLALNPFLERIPAELKKQYEEHLVEEMTKSSVTFNDSVTTCENAEEHKIGIKYHLFVLHLGKPATESCPNK